MSGLVTFPRSGARSALAVSDTKPCTPATRAGRLAKARQFLLAAETIATVVDNEEIADAL